MRRLSPTSILLYWDTKNSFRLMGINEKGASVVWLRCLQFLAVLLTLIGLVYWGAMESRPYIQEIMPLYLFEAGFYSLGLSILGLLFLIIGAGIAGANLFYREEDGWLRSLVIHEDLSYYKGVWDMVYGYSFFFFLSVFPFLFFCLFLWSRGLLLFLSEALVFVVFTLSMLLWGNLLLTVILSLVPPYRRRILFYAIIGGLIILLLSTFLLWELEDFLERFMEFLYRPYLPSAWGVDLLSLLRDGGWWGGGQLLRLGGLLGVLLTPFLLLRYWFWSLLYLSPERMS